LGFFDGQVGDFLVFVHVPFLYAKS
jgi:hypothetical protein